MFAHFPLIVCAMQNNRAKRKASRFPTTAFPVFVPHKLECKLKRSLFSPYPISLLNKEWNKRERRAEVPFSTLTLYFICVCFFFRVPLDDKQFLAPSTLKLPPENWENSLKSRPYRERGTLLFAGTRKCGENRAANFSLFSRPNNVKCNIFLNSK